MSDQIPTPPEQPSPDDCCGSGCATCVWDVYDQQVAQYKKEYEEYKKKYIIDKQKNTFPGKISVNNSPEKGSDALLPSTPITPAEEELLRQQQKLLDEISEADEDDDDDDENATARSLDPRISSSPSLLSRLTNAEAFLDPNHNISKNNGFENGGKAHQQNKFDGAVVVQLSTPPQSVALRTAVVPHENFLTFRKDNLDFVQVKVETEEERFINNSNANEFTSLLEEPYVKTILSIASVPNTKSDNDIPQSHFFQQRNENPFEPGDTVEVLRIPPTESVESFLRYLAFDGSIRTGALDDSKNPSRKLEQSLDEKRLKFMNKNNHFLTLSNGIMCDVSDFPFVDSPLPPWLEKCSSMQRTQQHPELETTQQTLPLGHMLRTVVDVYSWAAIQRPLIWKLLDVAESRLSLESDHHHHHHHQNSSSLFQNENEQVQALRCLAELSVSLVHLWMRCAWIVCCCVHISQPSLANVHDLLKSENQSSSNDFDQAKTSLPQELLSYKLPKDNFREEQKENSFGEGTKVDHNNNNIGSVEFLLRCFPIVKTELFPVPRSIFKNAKTNKAPPKVFSLARALEVLPPLKGRLFSVAAEDVSKNSVMLFSHFTKLLLNAKQEKEASRGDFPPWSGMVSSQLFYEKFSKATDVVVSSTPLLFMKRTDTKLKSKNIKKPQNLFMLNQSEQQQQQESKMEENFRTGLLSEMLSSSSSSSTSSSQNNRIFFLSAGSGFAPFHFFLSKFVTRQQQMLLFPDRKISVICGFRRPVSASFLLPSSSSFSLVAKNIDFHLAISRPAKSDVVENIGSSTDNPNVIVHHSNVRVPEVAVAEIMKEIREISDERRDSQVDIFTCGPPSFVKDCREKIEEINDNNLKLRWFNDDWSS